MRALLIASAGVALLGLGSLVALTVATPAPPPADAAPPLAELAPPGPQRASAIVAPVEARRASAAPAAARAAAPPESWDAILPRSQPTLVQAIARARPEVLDCLGGRGRGSRPAWKAPQASDRRAGVLMLQLDTVGDRLRLVDAPLEKKGNSGDPEIACVQAALRGLVLDVPGTRPGTRLRVPYRLAR